MKSCDLVTSVTAISCILRECYTDDELALLASIFQQLGDTITTILAQETLCDNKSDGNTPLNNIIF